MRRSLVTRVSDRTSGNFSSEGPSLSHDRPELVQSRCNSVPLVLIPFTWHGASVLVLYPIVSNLDAVPRKVLNETNAVLAVQEAIASICQTTS